MIDGFQPETDRGADRPIWCYPYADYRFVAAHALGIKQVWYDEPKRCADCDDLCGQTDDVAL